MRAAQRIIFIASVILVLLASFILLRPKNNSLLIEELKKGDYPGSEIKIEEILGTESDYSSYVVSYYSQGLKLYALLLVPETQKPTNGYPVIVLNHGYIIPDKYTPEGNYVPYFEAFVDNGYIVFKPNYRGHGKSEGSPTSAYYSSDYVVDVLNAIASIKKYKDVDQERIGMWGHSMGGNISLKVAEISKDIKALSIWSGVVAPIDDVINNWQSRVSYTPDLLDLELRNKGLDKLLQEKGNPSKNPMFWDKIDPNTYLPHINIPVQISVGLSDNQVPPSFSKGLYERLSGLNKIVEYNEYIGANHDINQSFTKAMKTTIKFFDTYLK